MTRLAAHILAVLRLGPRTTLHLAQVLDERTVTVENEMAKLVDKGIARREPEGWVLIEERAA